MSRTLWKTPTFTHIPHILYLQEDMLEHGPRSAADRALEAVVGRGDHLQQAGLAHHDVVARLEADLAGVGEADAARQVVARLVGHHAAPERVGHAVERGEEGGVVEGVVVGRLLTACGFYCKFLECNDSV